MASAPQAATQDFEDFDFEAMTAEGVLRWA